MATIGGKLMQNRSQAEQDAAYHRLAYRLELLIQRKRRSISRQTVEGGCVVLQPERFKRGAITGGENESTAPQP
jgi:hypothetical protein